jgi:hypothetical protein
MSLRAAGANDCRLIYLVNRVVGTVVAYESFFELQHRRHAACIFTRSVPCFSNFNMHASLVILQQAPAFTTVLGELLLKRYNSSTATAPERVAFIALLVGRESS